MFVTRTVAAEICLEVKTNEAAYNALKRLDKEGYLRFELAYVHTQCIRDIHADTLAALWQKT